MMKFYAVKAGRRTGIFESWAECSESVHGYPGAIYKSFKTYSEACQYLGDLAPQGTDGSGTQPEKASGTDNPGTLPGDSEEIDVGKAEEKVEEKEDERTPAEKKKRRFPKIRDHAEAERPDGFVLAASAKAYVDGSYLAATGEFSYGCVVLIGDTEIRLCEKMKDPELAAMHNVAGEIRGAEAAMRFAVTNGISELTIYHDYEGIARWCTGDWTATKPGTIAYSNFYQSLPEDLRVQFVKVRGHSGDTYNELADQLAKFALGIREVS
ncbi:MAG: ribonuclease H family protein [Lachnospiraceae bacterium]|nr:ribonuclease H family protein [Lachnospiraceae bacterium]